MVANEKAVEPSKPFTRLELYNGFEIAYPADMTEAEKERIGFYKPLERASLSEAEAVAIWDKVSATVRARPVSR
jgi:hypothetical protein